MKIYVTSNAMTRGIEEYDGKTGNGSHAIVYDSKFVDGLCCISPSNHHATMAEAIAKAKQMQSKKIKSLEKQLAKIKAIVFE